MKDKNKKGSAASFFQIRNTTPIKGGNLSKIINEDTRIKHKRLIR